MSQLKTTLAAAIATLGILLGSASESHAQSFGLSLNLGRGGFSYYQNDYVYSPYVYAPPVYYTPPIYPDVWDYRARRHHAHHNHTYSGIVPGAGTIIPERYHWTPYRGLHTHGSVYAPTYSGRIVRVPY